MAWEERGSCLNIFWRTNCGRISETFTNYEAKHLFRKPVKHVVSETRWFALYMRTRVVLMLKLESSWHGTSVDHVSTYFGRQIAVKSQKPSRITRQMTCCASESNTSVRVVFANQSGLILELKSSWHGRTVDHVLTYIEREIASGFDAPIGVVMAWEERGSCLNIFWTTNHGRISETFTNYEAKDLLRKSGFDAGIGVLMAWEERGSCLNIFQTSNCGRISETFTSYKSSWHRRRVDMSYHILDDKSWSDLKSHHELRGKRFVAQVSETRRLNLHELQGKTLVVQVSETRRFALYLRTGVVLMLQLESSWHARSVDHVLTYSGREIVVGSQKPSRIMKQKTCCANDKSRSDLRNLYELRGKRVVAHVIETRRFALYFRTRVDLMAWEVRGSCLNLFRMINRERISETFTSYEAKDSLRKLVKHVGKTLVAQVSETRRFALYLRTEVVLMLQLESSWNGRSVDHVLTYSGRQFAVVSHKPSRITRQKTCCASQGNTSVRVVFANRSGFDAPIAVIKAWEDLGSCLSIFRTKNRGRIKENYKAKDLLRK
ncbi:uncharacterized protein G2W53_026459 [Senna tora]|uniref:Uncharacterized protein n=1 Tax=Senna tora TaxID=362788 RepID=A0A834TH74_9FABA|nr:uncharacterized protein G2W53_026459 [Senna tora]